MAITFFNFASSPADNGSQDDSADISVTPPASMVAGDFFWMLGLQRNATQTLTLDVDGGQTWTQEAMHSQTTRSFRAWWGRYNGLGWAANPAIGTDAVQSEAFTLVMLVFRPTTGTNTWVSNVAEQINNFSGPSTPFDVTIPGQTTTVDSTVTIAAWMTNDNNSWSLQTGTWTALSTTQFRNTFGSASSISGDE
jgi:hypothetical protein